MTTVWTPVGVVSLSIGDPLLIDFDPLEICIDPLLIPNGAYVADPGVSTTFTAETGPTTSWTAA